MNQISQSYLAGKTCSCHEDQHHIYRQDDCPTHGTAALRARLERARRTRHQARLIADGQIVASGPWRSDHLQAVCDRTRIKEYMTANSINGQAEISTMALGVVA